jgi:hypothetical protein
LLVGKVKEAATVVGCSFAALSLRLGSLSLARISSIREV